MKRLSTNVEAKVILRASLKNPWMCRGSFGFICQPIQLKKKIIRLLHWWLQSGPLSGQMTKQDLTEIKQLSFFNT